MKCDIIEQLKPNININLNYNGFSFIIKEIKVFKN